MTTDASRRRALFPAQPEKGREFSRCFLYLSLLRRRRLLLDVFTIRR